MSLLGSNYLCSIQAYGGFTLNQLSEKLTGVTAGALKYYGTAIVFVGTNNVIAQKCEQQQFIAEFMKFILDFQARFQCAKVIVLGFLPRAYCVRQGCIVDKCRYMHAGSPSGFHKRILCINAALDDVFKHDVRLVESFKFLNLFGEIAVKGTWNNSFGGHLSVDGLHLSEKGNELLDNRIFEYLKSINL